MQERRVIVPPSGPILPGDFKLMVTVRSEHTDSVMSVIEETLAPKSFIPPHTHKNDVWVYVLSGEIGVLVGDDVARASEGQWALKPRDVMHAMWNATSAPAKIIEILTPGGSERWFEEVSQIHEGDQVRFDEACERYGIEFFRTSPWTEELRRRFGLH